MLCIVKKIYHYIGLPVVYIFLGFVLQITFVVSVIAYDGKDGPVDYNVVMVVINSLRADHLGCYGDHLNHSAHIDKVAEDGVIFDYTIAQSYWTLPSLVSMLTSRFVCAHNVDSRDAKLEEGTKTLAEVLSIYGYKTAAFTCGLDTVAAYGLGKGFDKYHVYSGTKAIGSFSDIMPLAMEWLNINQKNKFFLFLHSYDVHPPYKKGCNINNIISDYKGVFKDSMLGYGELRMINGNMFSRRGKKVILSAEDIDYIIANYDNGIRCVDEYIGYLIDQLKSLNIYEKTIIVICADHGEELGERGAFNRFGRKNLYQEVIRVPLIIKFSDSSLKGRRISSLAGMVDVMPTILDLLNIPVGHELQGISLSGLIRNSADRTANKYVIAEAGHDKWAIVRDDGWKLLHSLDGNELYDISNDPFERNNLIGKELDKEVILLKEFFVWREQHKEEKKGNYFKLDPNLIENLKKSGYW